ncbi:hypothetical protein BDV10DRAFT_178960 [Aspergillus recurvatus]
MLPSSNYRKERPGRLMGKLIWTRGHHLLCSKRHSTIIFDCRDRSRGQRQRNVCDAARSTRPAYVGLTRIASFLIAVAFTLYCRQAYYTI